jgi:outer membrane protein assembly factor BamB
MRMKASLLALTLSAFLLTGCETLSDVFTSDSEPHLKGERISALQLQNDLVPDTTLQQTPIVLPEAWTNQFWPQAGGYPTHAMGHMSLAPKLKKAWKVSVGAGGGERAPLTSAPISAENMVFTLDAAATIRAFDLSSGKKKWEQSIVPKGEDEVGAAGGGLAYAEGKIYATAGYKYLVALDVATGKTLWSKEIPAPARAAPTVLDGKVYLITLDNRLMVYSALDGADIWKFTGISETTNLLGAAAAAADPSTIILPLSSGEIYGLNPADGRVMWQDNLSAVRRAGALSAIADIRGLPVIDRGVVYAVSYSGRIVALNQTTGERLWQREVGSGDTPAAVGDVIFMLTTDQNLVALARQSGNIYWVTPMSVKTKKDADPVFWSGPVLAGGRLILAGSNGHLAEVNPADGKIIRSEDIGDGTLIPPVVVNGTLLVLDAQGELAAYR